MRLLLVLLLFTFSNILKAQLNDYIKNVNGDTINCKIKLINKDAILFEHKKNDKRFKISSLPLDEIEYYIR